jgi:hypothetical protein
LASPLNHRSICSFLHYVSFNLRGDTYDKPQSDTTLEERLKRTEALYVEVRKTGQEAFSPQDKREI